MPDPVVVMSISFVSADEANATNSFARSSSAAFGLMPIAHPAFNAPDTDPSGPSGNGATPQPSTICDCSGSCANTPRSVQNSIMPTFPARNCGSACSKPISSGLGRAYSETSSIACAASTATSLSSCGICESMGSLDIVASRLKNDEPMLNALLDPSSAVP